jgi:hypothetical protein
VLVIYYMAWSCMQGTYAVDYILAMYTYIHSAPISHPLLRRSCDEHLAEELKPDTLSAVAARLYPSPMAHLTVAPAFSGPEMQVPHGPGRLWPAAKSVNVWPWCILGLKRWGCMGCAWVGFAGRRPHRGNPTTGSGAGAAGFGVRRHFAHAGWSYWAMSTSISGPFQPQFLSTSLPLLVQQLRRLIFVLSSRQ